VGRLAVGAALARDHPVLVGTVVTACAVAWLANLLADLLAQCLDPRIPRPAP
jgi:ABC-type dipeptide/oligopeptide/nickel transport system permease component